MDLTLLQIDNPLLTILAIALDNTLFFCIFTLFIVLASERRKEKIAKIMLAVLLAALLITTMKLILKVERPCTIFASKIPCPEDYSFPSGHTLFAFTVMLAFLNKPVFPIYFIYAIFVAFTRIYLGVHTFEDIAGSIAFAPFVYYITDCIWIRFEGKKYAFRDEPCQ